MITFCSCRLPVISNSKGSISFLETALYHSLQPCETSQPQPQLHGDPSANAHGAPKQFWPPKYFPMQHHDEDDDGIPCASPQPQPFRALTANARFPSILDGVPRRLALAAAVIRITRRVLPSGVAFSGQNCSAWRSFSTIATEERSNINHRIVGTHF